MSAARSLLVILVKYNPNNLKSEALQLIFDKVELISAGHVSHNRPVALRERFPDVKLIAADEHSGFEGADRTAALPESWIERPIREKKLSFQKHGIGIGLHKLHQVLGHVQLAAAKIGLIGRYGRECTRTLGKIQLWPLQLRATAVSALAVLIKIKRIEDAELWKSITKLQAELDIRLQLSLARSQIG